MARFITFLSDFGLQDGFVGTCHGVMKRIAPNVEIIDITHGIAPQQVLEGALVLAATLEYMPLGVHLAVVDPGVGGGRRPLALEDGEGRLYVGPDNGLLVPAAEAGGGIAAVHELANPRYALQPVSRTFHGRDLFAPAAAHLALGVSPAELGPPLDPEVLVRLTVPEPEVVPPRVGATALTVDHFGNVRLNLAPDSLGADGVEPGTPVGLDLPTGRQNAVFARTFTDVAPGDLAVYEDSTGNVALAVSGGSAAETLGLTPGQRVWIEIHSP
jgi:S-adenosyl-L-methionine hydrolase (adenosine-forming)